MTDYECTLLAGIPNAPSVYSLTANPELAEQRQEYVVQRMVQYGYISEDEAQSILQDQS
jgi:membrane peptidoglycan carboxypeptidase